MKKLILLDGSEIQLDNIAGTDTELMVSIISNLSFEEMYNLFNRNNTKELRYIDDDGYEYMYRDYSIDNGRINVSFREQTNQNARMANPQPNIVYSFRLQKPTPEERIRVLEQQLEALTYFVSDVAAGVQEIIKKDDSEMPVGDYVNPIPYAEGMTVETGKFYTNGDDIWEAVQSGTPNSFEDRDYFDIIG